MASLTAIARKPRRTLPAWLWPSADDVGIEHPTLLRTGLALAFLYLLLVYLPDNVYSILRFVVHPLAVVWLALAIPKMSGRLKFSFPFYALLLLQVWVVVSMILTETFVSKPVMTGLYLWFPLEMGMIYVLIIGLGALLKDVSRYLINWFLLLSALSGFMAMLQALHVGPAIRVANYYVYRSIASWDNVSGVRASGLSMNPNANVLVMLVAAGFIAYKSSKRSLRWYELGLWALFLAASFVAQHRSSMPLVGLTFLVTTFIIFRRRPAAIVTVIVSAMVLFAMTAILFKHNFAYTFETQWSANSPELRGRLAEEAQAYRFYQHYPITGVGPNPVTESTAIRPSNEFDIKVENLYYAFLLTFGVPGLVLTLTMYLSALVISFSLSLNRQFPRDSRVLMATGALGAINLLWTGNVGVNLTQYHEMFPYMMLLAVAQLAVTQRVALRRHHVSPYLQTRDDAANQLARL